MPKALLVPKRPPVNLLCWPTPYQIGANAGPELVFAVATGPNVPSNRVPCRAKYFPVRACPFALRLACPICHSILLFRPGNRCGSKSESESISEYADASTTRGAMGVSNVADFCMYPKAGL